MAAPETVHELPPAISAICTVGRGGNSCKLTAKPGYISI